MINLTPDKSLQEMLALSVIKKVTSLVNALMLDLNVVAVVEEIPELVSNAVNKATCLANALKEEVEVEEVVETEPASSVNKKDT